LLDLKQKILKFAIFKSFFAFIECNHMKQLSCQIPIATCIFLSCLVVSNPVWGQISSDGTIPTKVERSGNRFEITGGSQAGGNLFHSFKEFSLPTGSEAFFKNATNATDVINIISRVTGNTPSNLDGLLRENYGANFVLINPNGINFGANARLQIGGSFLASTANSIEFADGNEFSTTDASADPLLTVSVPVGLQFPEEPAPINVRGTGHNFTADNPIFSSIERDPNLEGLEVNEGETLALVGGDLNLDGGILSAEGGRIELGSVETGEVAIANLSQGWQLDYENASSFKDIEMRSRALLDTSGLQGGEMQLRAANLSISEGSLVLSQNQGNLPSGEIGVDVSDLLEVTGTANNGTILSGIIGETQLAGRGGNINVSARQVRVEDGAAITARTFNSAAGGNIKIDASESVRVAGSASLPGTTSSIATTTYNKATAGNNTITTQRLTAEAGGTITSATFGRGRGGDVTINASDFIEVLGIEPTQLSPSGLIASTFSSGNAGNLFVNTSKLTVLDGGRVGASTFAFGKAGNVSVSATEAIEVRGTPRVTNENNINTSSVISSSATIVAPSLQNTFRLPERPSGNSGNVTIKTRRAIVTDEGLITTDNEGFGNAGRLAIEADSIFLSNNAAFTASTGEESESTTSIDNNNTNYEMGNAGSINITVRDTFEVTDNSRIENINNGSTPAGNVTVRTGQLVLSNNSLVTTTALEEGKGGDLIVRASDIQIIGNGFEIDRNTVEQIARGNSPPEFATGLFTGTFGTGEAGKLDIATKQLTLTQGGFISTSTFGRGKGGNLEIEAAEQVELLGSSITSTTPSNSEAPAGNVTIATQNLRIFDGSAISTSTFGNGEGGKLTIAASEEIVLRNTLEDMQVNAPLTGLFTGSFGGTGKAGDLQINTQRLSIQQGAGISTQSGVASPNETIGGGDGGTLTITAEEIELSQSPNSQPSFLTTATVGGARAGDLNITTGQLSLLENSRISATAGERSDGGNINLDADTVLLLENSNIIADADRGRGGNISINTQGLFRCSDCTISASSNLGVEGEGEIEIITPEGDTGLEFVELPEQVTNPNDVVALACSSAPGQPRSEFVITGRGGLPPRPGDPLSSDALVSFDSPSSATSPDDERGTTENEDASQLPPPAQGWYVNDRGAVVLGDRVSAKTQSASGITSPTCHVRQTEVR
jgi:filamentous hemagglutinin family protein